jgi:hypothetical protein
MPINFLMKVGIFLINRSSYSVQYTFTNKIQKKKKNAQRQANASKKERTRSNSRENGRQGRRMWGNPQE